MQCALVPSPPLFIFIFIIFWMVIGAAALEIAGSVAIPLSECKASAVVERSLNWKEYSEWRG